MPFFRIRIFGLCSCAPRSLIKKRIGGWFPYLLALAATCALFAFRISGSHLVHEPVSASGRQSGPQGQAAGGAMANAGSHVAVFDAQHRTITAGGFVKTGPIVFEDVAKQAGLTTWQDKAGTPEKRLILEIKGPGVCLLDYNNDGWLDIYLVNGSTYDALGGRAIPPHAALFHNNGNGTFEDVSKKLGVDDPSGYYGLGAVFADVNNDGKPDLLVANDSTPNYLYINQGNGTFEDDSDFSGYAFNKSGREVSNMGIAVGDDRNNGHLDVVNTDFADDYNVLFQNDGHGNFTDESYQAGIAVSSIPFVSFGDGFLDYDNDGWLDLFIANGQVYPLVDRHPEWGESYAERPLLYHNLKNGRFTLVPAVEGTAPSCQED